MSISTLCRGSFIAVACWAASSAWAAAPETPDAELPPVDMPAVTPVLIYELDTEMVVKDWVLCVSAAVALGADAKGRKEEACRRRNNSAVLQQPGIESG